MADKNLKVLVVDDEKAVREFLVRFLKLQQIDSQIAQDGLEALEFAKKEKFDLVLWISACQNERIASLRGIKKYNLI